MGEPLRDNLVFIEFIGLPGAGKSTISRDLHIALARSGINVVCVKDVMDANWRTGGDVKKIVRQLFFYLAYVIRHVGLAKQLLGYVLKTKPFSVSDGSRIRHIFGLDEVYHRIKSGQLSDSSDVALSDDGFLQVIWTLTSMRDVPCEKYVRRILENLLTRHRIYPVYLVVDPHTALDRMLGREKLGSRIPLCSRDEALERLEQQQKSIRFMYEVSKQLSRHGGLSLSALRGISENVDAIIEGISKNVVAVPRGSQAHRTPGAACGPGR